MDAMNKTGRSIGNNSPSQIIAEDNTSNAVTSRRSKPISSFMNQSSKEIKKPSFTASSFTKGLKPQKSDYLSNDPKKGKTFLQMSKTEKRLTLGAVNEVKWKTPKIKQPLSPKGPLTNQMPE